MRGAFPIIAPTVVHDTINSRQISIVIKEKIFVKTLVLFHIVTSRIYYIFFLTDKIGSRWFQKTSQRFYQKIILLSFYFHKVITDLIGSTAVEGGR